MVNLSWRESEGLVADSTGASSVCPNRFNTAAPKTFSASSIIAAGTFDAPPMITLNVGAGVDVRRWHSSSAPRIVGT